MHCQDASIEKLSCKHTCSCIKIASMSEERLLEENQVTGRARGGHARAAILSNSERAAIAKRAALARWEGSRLRATHEGDLQIGDTLISCAVLSDGRRVLSQSGFMKALGRSRQAKGRAYYRGDVNLPAFLTAQNLKPFIHSGLEVTSSQIEFRAKNGTKAFGYSADLLPQVVGVFMDADRAGAITSSQRHIADRAFLLGKALMNVAIAALVDEVTGYQEVRAKDALRAILDAYLRKELAAWAKRFPDEFYQQIYRLRGWGWEGRRKNPPQVVATYTKDIVYSRLAPQIIQELEKRNPIDGGRRKSKHHQWLTEDVGHPALAQHLHAVITLMRVCQTWDHFKHLLDIAHPKRGDTLMLPMMADVIPSHPIELSPPSAQLPLSVQE